MKPVSGWWYLLGVAVIVLGTAGALILGLTGILQRIAAMPRGLMPGRLALTLQPGEYELYIEERSIIDGQGYVSAHDAGMRCVVVSEATGSTVPITSPSTSSSYTAGSYKGRTAGSFRVEAAGDYRVECEVEPSAVSQPGGAGPRVVVAVGSGIAGAIGWTVGIAVGAIVVGGILVFVVRSQRKRWRLAQRSATPPPSAPPPATVPPES
ncbi:MAG: hypothetical protein GYA57_15030 [Myxococcales bacterium]|nr:hypothetical protein [Myxococcales bacterium]